MESDVIRCISVSGGKDSTACALLALERHERDSIRLVFADTGNEHEITYEYVNHYLPSVLGIPVHTVRADFAAQITKKREYILSHWERKGVPAEKVKRAAACMVPTGNPYLDLCIWKNRFPSRMAQFCTTELKVGPLIEHQMALVEEHGAVESWQGVRRDESRNRKDALEREDLGGGFTIYRPIVDWTAQQTVDYVLSQGLKLNGLYKQGMTRVGCMPCINAKKSEIFEIAKRFPEHIERIAEWELIVKEVSKRNAATFFVAANIAGNPTPEECFAVANINEMVRWSKTAYGGRKMDMFKALEFVDSPTCSSAYGLCE